MVEKDKSWGSLSDDEDKMFIKQRSTDTVSSVGTVNTIGSNATPLRTVQGVKHRISEKRGAKKRFVQILVKCLCMAAVIFMFGMLVNVFFFNQDLSWFLSATSGCFSTSFNAKVSDDDVDVIRVPLYSSERHMSDQINSGKSGLQVAGNKRTTKPRPPPPPPPPPPRPVTLPPRMPGWYTGSGWRS